MQVSNFKATASGNSRVSLEEIGSGLGVLPQATVSTANVSSSAINNGSNYTGTWEDASNYNSLVVAIKTDQNGYYEIQFSPDGTNIDSTLTRYYNTDKIEPPHRFTVTRQYFRVIFYNNSGSNQTFFRLQVLLGDKNDLNIPADSIMAQDFDSVSTRPTDYTTEVAMGRREGSTPWSKWGYNADVDTGSEETVWFAGGRLTTLTSASTLTIVSSSGNDTNSSGTGARTITITGIDANRNYQAETFEMSGVTPVVSTSTWLGINRVEVLSFGSQKVNDGTITITATTGGSTQASIPVGKSVTQQAFFFTESSHTFLAKWLWVNINKLVGGTAPVVTIRAWLHNFDRGGMYEVFREDLDTNVENTIELHPSEPFIVPENCLLEFTAETDSDNTIVNIRFSGKLTRNIN